MRIQIETIPHDKQRYETVGDWFYDSNGVLHIKVSQMSDERYAALVAVHELIEVLLCKQHGVTQEQVDKFDMNWQPAKDSLAPELDEPGDDPRAPYKNEHCVAMGIERILAAGLGVDWVTYEKELFKL